MGIVVPFVNTPEEAGLDARACRYPPTGTRGWGPHRAARYGLLATSPSWPRPAAASSTDSLPCGSEVVGLNWKHARKMEPVGSKTRK